VKRLGGVVFCVALLSWGATAEAQVAPESARGLFWSNVNNCPQANAFGPQVYLDVQADQPNAEEELMQLNRILAGCQQAAAAPRGPSAAETVVAVLQFVAALQQQWSMMHNNSQSAYVYPQTRYRTWVPIRQARYVPVLLPIYIAPRPTARPVVILRRRL